MDAKHIEMMKESAKTGAIVSAVASSTLQYRDVKNGKVDINEAGFNVLKETIQGSIATVSVMSAIRCDKGLLAQLAILGVGVAGIYGVEAMSEKRKEAKGVTNA